MINPPVILNMDAENEKSKEDSNQSAENEEEKFLNFNEDIEVN